MIQIIIPYLITGIIYGIGAIGVGFILRYLQAPDFTCLGAIMVGGVVSVVFSNLAGPWIGLLAGSLAGAAMGLVTAFLRCTLRIPLVLAGIITFTASISIGYFITNFGGSGGTIAMKNPADSLLHPVFFIGDAFALAFLVIAICVFGWLIMKTKLGSLVLALRADSHYVACRHRYFSYTVTGVLVFGNLLIGLAGALSSMKDVAAHVVAHSKFLPYALGAVFGAQAVKSFISGKFQFLRKDADSDKTKSKGPMQFVNDIRDVLLTTKDDASTIGYYFAAYVVGCIAMSCIAGLAVEASAGKVIPGITFPGDFEHLVTAVVMTIFVVIASSANELEKGDNQ